MLTRCYLGLFFPESPEDYLAQLVHITKYEAHCTSYEFFKMKNLNYFQHVVNRSDFSDSVRKNIGFFFFAYVNPT